MIIKTDSSKVYCKIIWIDSTSIYYSRFDGTKEQSISKEKVWACYGYNKGLLYENKKFIAFLERDEEQDTSLLVKDSVYVNPSPTNSLVRVDTIKPPPVNLNAELIQNQNNAYYYQGQRITMMQMKRIMAGNNEASTELKEALNRKNDYKIFAYLGAPTLAAGVTGITTYSTLKTGNLAAGIILTGIGIGFIIPRLVEKNSIYKHVNKAVIIYNMQISNPVKMESRDK